ncbi:helix-turn-helix domain-containing protein [Senegalia massiliensis]|uniref:XRE family transcriptional regulator n=1 Tax=Senegalia massiliensis TaxID=1720316 RepID=A0A845R0T8_9CLOT|nr:helix-turn-helix transcriptional regulator [Senegalia massiliensis]NBI07619.1 XRE family transcriptional regulator [Senegalia massiliensis]
MFNVGKRIKELRKKMNIEGKELAKELDISPSYLSKLESNIRPTSVEKIEKICEISNISLSDFFNTNQESKIELDIAENIYLNPKLNELFTELQYMDEDKLELILKLIKNFK